MFKKIVIASAILAATSSLAFAADAAPYVGASLGWNNNTFNLKNSTGSTSTNFNANGLTGGVFGGVGAKVNQNIYLGGEAFVNGGSMTSTNKTTDTFGTTDKLNKTYSFGLDFVPGIMVTDTTKVYAKAGVVRSRFKLTQNAGVGSGLTSGSTSTSATGGRLGLGVQTEVNKSFDVRGEFVHTAYSSFTTYGNKIKPSNNELTLGLVYKID